jgi:hypothetical protein
MGANDPPGPLDGSGGGLALEEALLLEEACEVFEAAWQAGGRPDVDAAVLGLPQELRPAALRELVSLDAHYRTRTPTSLTDRFRGSTRNNSSSTLAGRSGWAHITTWSSRPSRRPARKSARRA